MIITLAACGTAAHAADDRWWMHIGGAKITFDEKISLSVAGTTVPGASATVSNNTALIIETGYRLTPEWSVSATVGTPPTSTATGTGAAQPFGKIGAITYGPLVLNAQYHFTGFEKVRPYVGAGAVYYIVLKSQDAAVQQLGASSGWGSGVQAGLEFPLSERYGLFFDVKRLFITTKATGVMAALGGAPISSTIKLNPLVLHAGFSLSF